MTTPHRLQISGVLLRSRVNKGNRALLILRTLKWSCHPFIPTGDKNHSWVILNCMLPLLSNIITPIDRAGGGIIFIRMESVVEASATVLSLAVKRGVPKFNLRMLCGRNAHGFVLPVLIHKDKLRTFKRHPRKRALLFNVFRRPLC